jgi:3-methyladenine DNA glycosylase AlkD
MPATKKKTKPVQRLNAAQVQEQVQIALESLKQMSTQHTLDSLPRYGIAATNALGVSMSDVQKLAKRLGRSHELAVALWETNIYEARMLTSFVAEPERVTAAQMDRWCRDFDNWAVCDTLCFKLFDRTPHAWAKVAKWGDKREEFVKRAAFALLASLATHDKSATDEQFIECLPLIERAATDERNFVKKGVSWALRGLGRRNATLNEAAVAVSRRLAASPERAARWIGKDALKELTSALVKRQLAAQASRKEKK